jgi:hypothetical protein
VKPFLLGYYGYIFHGIGNSTQLYQNFGFFFGGGVVLTPKKTPSPVLHCVITNLYSQERQCVLDTELWEPSHKHCYRTNRTMNFLVIVVGKDVALNNIKVFNVAMYMQQGVTKALLNYRLFRIVITNNEL